MEEHEIMMEEIKSFIESDCIPVRYILRWMNSSDIEVLGAVEAILMDPQLYDRIKPQPPDEVVFDFLLNYYRRCILEDPQGEWCLSRYIAAHSLKSWFMALWAHRQVYQATIDRIKMMLADLYRHGDNEVKDAVVNGALEHLFEDPSVAKYFSDWANDPELKTAFEEALEWAVDSWDVGGENLEQILRCIRGPKGS
jgi:hypothetical protein